ncbi:MAG: CHRD domain-containing protein [Thermoleophilia bacterium]
MRRLVVCLATAALFAPAALALPSAMHPELGAKLLGKNEVPKGSKTAHGIVNLNLKSGAGKVCWTFTLVGVAKPLAAHIHKGRAGVSGPVFIPLGSKYTAKGCVSAPKKMIDAVESNPNGFYVNVHNSKYPNGVVRGQLVAGMVHM